MNNKVTTQFEKRTRAFPLGPDNTALFLGRDYRRAIEGIREDMRQGCGLICLVGPAGIGKSMLLRSLRTHLPHGIISEISQPPLGGLLPRLAAGLGAHVADDDEAAVQQLFREYFATQSQKDNAIIQVIDDAESLTHDDLALLHRLFESIKGQVLLIGQPPLQSLFANDDGTRTRIQPDRIYHLEPLSPEEVGEYIRHRLNEAGFDRELFVPEAIAAVNAYSGGLPRLINLLCFTALASSEFDVSTPIAAECVHEAARQRMEIGNYPFMRPPLAPGWRPIPIAAEEHNASGSSRNDMKVAEVAALHGGDRHSGSARTLRFGYGRIFLTLMAGVAMGMMVSQMMMPGSPTQADSASHDSTAQASSSMDSYLQRVKAGLVDMAEWIISWAGPGSPSAEGTVTTGGELRSRPQSNNNSPTITGRQTPAAPRAHTADVASSAENGASKKIKEAQPVAVTTSGQTKDSVNSKLHGKTPLTAVQREHLADLYADRAQYEIQSDRLKDAQVSIKRGLRLAPDDSRLHELDKSVLAAMAARRHDTPQQMKAGDKEHKIPQGTPSLPVEIIPPQKGAQPYLQQTTYVWPGRWQETLAEINYGPQEKPE